MESKPEGAAAERGETSDGGTAAAEADAGSGPVTRRGLLAGALALVGVAVAVVLVARARLASAHERLAEDLVADATAPTDEPFTREDLTGLPEPVQRYFETALTEGQPYVETARVTQDGQLRLGEADSPWKSMTATNTVSVSPPGFVWDAEVEMAPFVPVSVVDTYHDGAGSLRAKLLSLVTVAEDGPGPEMDEGELLRYLAEAPWYPTALLPESGVEWESVDDDTARATLTHDGTTASAVFHFDAEHRIERVVADRPRGTDDGYERTRWTGRFRDYERRDGMLVPTSGEVEWNLPDGDLPYWRATITGFDYRPSPDGE